MRLIPLFLLVAVCAGCSSGGTDDRIIQLPSGSATAETVNGTPVPASLLDAVARAHKLDPAQAEQRDKALALVTDMVLLAQAAQRENFAADEDYRAQVEAARLQGVSDATFAQFQQRTPISDAMLKAEYDNQVARAGTQVYDFSQLLFDNEADALSAEGELVMGTPFDEVYDEWRHKAKQARFFSRVRRDQVPEALAKALASLQNGQTTKAPVKTDFGWHVVHLDIANPFTPAPFDQVKDGIRRGMLLKIGRERLDKLKQQAKIEYPPGMAAPAEPDAAGKPAVGTKD
jgi:peptidyl-prolyl cis-trans isomerase C